MILNKWNFETKEYEPFDSPAEKPALYVEDLEELRSCANCGEDLEFGQMYTSRTIHTHMGLGYGVCEECYQKEFEDEKNARK